MMHCYLDFPIRFDYTFMTVKYTMQMILGGKQDSEEGSLFLKSVTMRDLCRAYRREKELVKRQVRKGRYLFFICD